MMDIEIPGREKLVLKTLLLDYNGTIAADGILLPALSERIKELRRRLSVKLLTADTYGSVRSQCDALGIEISTFPREGAAGCKAEIASSCGGGVVSLGNGFNDIPMFDASLLSIAVLDREGLCASLLSHADVLVLSAADGLDLLLKPDRLRATLRS